jgi:UDP-N-acetylglucosamine 2-epimerase (non-hydrolysing)
MNPIAKVALVFGTRPEATKLFSVRRALLALGCSTVTVSSGQHSELLTDTCRDIGMPIDLNLALMQPGQTVESFVARAFEQLPRAFAQVAPDAVFVQGDTATAMAGALAAYYAKIPVAHVEAGLRSYDHAHPFPEEMHRQVVARAARWHFAPTEAARANLLSERIAPGDIYVTGNTGVDALLTIAARATERAHEAPFVLVTLHRRESFGAPLRDIVRAMTEFLERESDARILWPVHPNPAVAEALRESGVAHGRLETCAPLAYTQFVAALGACRFILSDSGGVQEEAPSLGKRVLVARETTERPEAVESGWNRLVGRSQEGVLAALRTAWSEPQWTGTLPAPNPYGDGRAGERIASILLGKPT